MAAPNGVIDLDEFERALAAIDGPVIVVGNAGEVNTGAFDDLAGLAERCAAHPGGAWLHVDAAFGLFAAASPRFAHLTRGIERADSVGADAHKWLNVPYDGGFAFVRDADALRAAFDATGAYLTPPPGAGWNPSATCRRCRAASGRCRSGAPSGPTAGPATARSSNAASTTPACLATGSSGRLDSSCSPRCTSTSSATGSGPPAPTPPSVDAINREANLALQAGGQAFVSPTVWNGMAAIRSAFDNWATQARDVDLLCEAVADQVARYAR